MSWVWLNFPLGAVFFLAMTGIPLWLVFKRPDNGPSFDAVPAAATYDSLRGRRQRLRTGHAQHDRRPDRGAPRSGRASARPLYLAVRQTARSPSATSPSTSTSAVTYAWARPSSPGCHIILRRACRLRRITTGLSGGPPSLPPEARSRSGGSVPKTCFITSMNSPAAPSRGRVVSAESPLTARSRSRAARLAGAPAGTGRPAGNPSGTRLRSSSGTAATSGRRSRRNPADAAPMP